MSLLDMLLSAPSAMDQALQVIAMTQQSGGGSLRPSGSSQLQAVAGGQDPWGADPNGYNPVSRHGVTLDREAMRSLIEARRAGYNAFPFIGQGYRSPEQSAAMLNSNNGLPHAQPGYSMHNYGLAFDAGDLPSRVRDYLTANGWYWGNSFGDPPHYSYYREG